MARISFTDEASESFANFLQHIEGYTVEVTPADGKRKYDAIVVGSAADATGDYFGVRVQQVSDKGDPTGVPFDEIVSDLKVY